MSCTSERSMGMIHKPVHSLIVSFCDELVKERTPVHVRVNMILPTGVVYRGYYVGGRDGNVVSMNCTKPGCKRNVKSVRAQDGRKYQLKHCVVTQDAEVYCHDHCPVSIRLKNEEKAKKEEALKNMPSSECSICMENKCDVMLMCGHTFHNKCIKKWKETAEKMSCPCCRNEHNAHLTFCSEEERQTAIQNSLVVLQIESDRAERVINRFIQKTHDMAVLRTQLHKWTGH